MNKRHNQNLELGLQEIDFTALETAFAVPPDALSNLELMMTNSAFGYEYAVKALEEEGEFSIRAEQILNEIEAHKAAYFEARLQMCTLDAVHLENFESTLKAEKATIFNKTNYLH
jgi:hypothetical protein